MKVASVPQIVSRRTRCTYRAVVRTWMWPRQHRPSIADQADSVAIAVGEHLGDVAVWGLVPLHVGSAGEHGAVGRDRLPRPHSRDSPLRIFSFVSRTSTETSFTEAISASG